MKKSTKQTIRFMTLYLGLTTLLAPQIYAHIEPPTQVESLVYIGTGMGYSSGNKKVIHKKCYDTSIAEDNCEAYFTVEHNLSSDDFFDTTETRHTTSENYIFGSRTKTTIHRKNDIDKKKSVDIKFIYAINNQVRLQLNGEELSEFGKQTYENDIENFVSICGDSYISDFTRGASIEITYTAKFKKQEQMEGFVEHVSKSFGGFYHSADTIQKEAQGEYSTGELSITATQNGGNVLRLPQIIADHGGNGNVISCQLGDMQQCVDAVHDIFDYIIEDFAAKQVGCNPAKGLTILKDLDYKYIETTAREVPTRSASPKIKAAKKELTDRIKEYKYYKDHNKNPKSDEAIKSSLVLMEHALVTCNNYLDKCISAKEESLEKITIIGLGDLKDY